MLRFVGSDFSELTLGVLVLPLLGSGVNGHKHVLQLLHIK